MLRFVATLFFSIFILSCATTSYDTDINLSHLERGSSNMGQMRSFVNLSILDGRRDPGVIGYRQTDYGSSKAAISSDPLLTQKISSATTAMLANNGIGTSYNATKSLRITLQDLRYTSILHFGSFKVDVKCIMIFDVISGGRVIYTSTQSGAESGSYMMSLSKSTNNDLISKSISNAIVNAFNDREFINNLQ